MFRPQIVLNLVRDVLLMHFSGFVSVGVPSGTMVPPTLERPRQALLKAHPEDDERASEDSQSEAANVTSTKVLYVSGEESVDQVRSRVAK